MKKIFIILGILSIFGWCEIKIATTDEITNSIRLIENLIKEEKENIVQILSEAIEIEKRALTLSHAEKIREKICKTSKITKKEFDNLRNSFSYLDIVIIWAVSQVKNLSINEVIKLRNEKGIEGLLSEIDEIEKDKILEKIKDLNPRLKTS